MKRILFSILGVLAFVGTSHAQIVNPGIQQSGSVTAGHMTIWGPGVGQVQDGGIAPTGDINSVDLSSTNLNITGSPCASGACAFTADLPVVVIGASVGSATVTPVLTFDNFGRVTNIGNATIAPPFSSITGVIGCSQLATLTGDVANTLCAVTVNKVNGVAYSASPASDTVPLITAANTATYTAIPNCTTGLLQYSTATHLFSCGSAGAGTVTNIVADGGVTTSNGSSITSSGTIYVQQIEPGGRLTLTSGVPVMTSDVSAATIIYYAPFKHGFVPLYNGTIMRLYSYLSSASDAVGLSVTLGSNWAANSNYDWFAANDGGTIRMCSGPAWTNDTTRNANISPFNGIQTNSALMICRYNNTTTINCATNQCTYLGTMRTGAAGQTNFIQGGSGLGGVAAIIGIWNKYNQVPWSANVYDTTDTWTYTTVSWRAYNGSGTGSGLNNRISYVAGIDGIAINANFVGAGSTSSLPCRVSIGFDTTTNSSAGVMMAPFASVSPMPTPFNTRSGIGFHYLQAVEIGNTGCNLYGDNGGGTLIQTGLTASGMY